ncbi:MAG: M20/M25/M40 family metallo-hydrolase, partial [Vicinamibacterales bacterium]
MTRRQMLLLPAACLAVLLAGGLRLSAQAPSETVDLDALARIKAEGFERSDVMNLAWWLTEASGSRLTNSPGMRAAADWAVKTLGSWGLVHVAEEPWGEDFGRGWSNERTVLHVVTPTPWPAIAYAKAWTPGTGGAVTAAAVLAPMTTEADFAKYAGTLKGKVVLLQAPLEVTPIFEAPAHRYTDEELDQLAMQSPPTGGGRNFDFAAVRAFQVKRNAFLLEQGVAAVLEPGPRVGDSGSVLVSAGGSRDPKDPPVPTQLAVATEHYNRMARLLQHDIPVTVEVDVRSTFQDRDLGMYNIVAEIPGTDKADEIVMLGAHFDSWHGGTGATDNAAGSAVMMEAMRILKQSGVRLRRTVRLALWTGEEQGLLGSRDYVK